MNKKLLGLTLIALAFSAASLAADSAPGNEPCRQIVEACKTAGFEKGQAKEGKGLFKDCVGPITHGQTVAGVTVDSATVQACQAKQAKWKSKNANQ